MIRLVEALNFRCLRHVHRPLGPFHILVGPNASGKTTFLDVIAFLGRLVSDGLEAAVSERTQNFQDLLWNRQGRSFSLVIEAAIPPERRPKRSSEAFDGISYGVEIGLTEATGELAILEEQVWLNTLGPQASQRRSLFPEEPSPPAGLLWSAGRPSRRKSDLLSAGTPWIHMVLHKKETGTVDFHAEASDHSDQVRPPLFRLGPRKSALGNLPEDESQFPAATWLKGLLAEGVQSLVLNSQLLRKASPPGQGRMFKTDGSNLPWVVTELAKTTERFESWIAHLRTALPELQGIRVVERPDDRHRYLVLRYQGGLEVPSWMASDGTLRLLALTLPAYLPEFKGIYLIEEPENGIHPCAVETAYQSLSSVYDAQILLATHSPVILSLAEVDQVLCFKKTPSGATDIVLGTEHPDLISWKGEISLGTLFAGGVLG